MATAVTTWSFGYMLMQGSDLWWHLAGGRWMLEHRTTFVPDPFSFSVAGKRWVNDSWLADVQLYLWARAFGMDSLVYWKWGMMIATWGLLFRLVVRLGSDRCSAFLATLLGLSVAAPFLDVRTQLYSFFLWVVVLDLTIGRKRPSAFLPLVFLLWVNLHAVFIFGLVSLPFLLLPWFSGRDRRRTALLAVACLFACLVNPNGTEVVVRPFRYAFDTTSPWRGLGEWLPPFRPGGIPAEMYPYAIAVFGISALPTLFRERWNQSREAKVALVSVALGFLTLAMSLRSRRFIPLFALAQVLVVARSLAGVIRPLFERIPQVLPPLLAFALGVFWLLPYPARPYAFRYLAYEFVLPVETCNFIEANEIAGNVFNYYNWGGYLHLRTNGRLKVFVDGRADQLYPDEIFTRYLEVFHTRDGWMDVIESSGAEYFLWPKGGRPVRALLESGRWRPLYSDVRSVLLVRSDRWPNRPLKETPDSAYKQLLLGEHAMNGRRYADAEKHFRRALEMSPSHQSACEQLARVQVLAGDVEEGWQTFEGCQRVFPYPARRAWFRGAVGGRSPQAPAQPQPKPAVDPPTLPWPARPGSVLPLPQAPPATR